jgi:hypothetical protein
MTRTCVVTVLAALLTLGGCNNALYYYDKANLALSIEGRPDPTAPAQVSIGYKQRTVVVAPPIKNKADGTGTCSADTDAVAMIGSFHASHRGKLKQTTIRTGFLTGEAAVFKEDKDGQKAAQAAARAISTTVAQPTADQVAAGFIEEAKKQNLCAQVRPLFAASRPFGPYASFTDAEKKALGRIDYDEQDHSEPLFKSMQKLVGTCQ